MHEATDPGESSELAARCHPATVWAVDQTGVRVLRRDTGKTRHLPYPDAAVWDLVTRRVPAPRLVTMISTLIGEERSSAGAWIARTIRQWKQEGWLIGGEGDG